MVSVVEADALMKMNRTKGNDSPPKEREQRTEAKNLTGPQIRLFRKRRGWTQHRLAESFKKAGIPITRDIIASIETQRCCVTDCQIVYFAQALGVSWKSLFPDKTSLETFTPSVLTSKHHQDNSNPITTKRPKFASASANNWRLCEMTCKSVKVIFRASS